MPYTHDPSKFRLDDLNPKIDGCIKNVNIRIRNVDTSTNGHLFDPRRELEAAKAEATASLRKAEKLLEQLSNEVKEVRLECRNASGRFAGTEKTIHDHSATLSYLTQAVSPIPNSVAILIPTNPPALPTFDIPYDSTSVSDCPLESRRSVILRLVWTTSLDGYPSFPQRHPLSRQ
jgi:hypothetical protein